MLPFLKTFRYCFFFQDIAWLPQWLQPYGTPTVGDHRNTTTAVSSPSCQVLFLFSALVGSESVDSYYVFVTEDLNKIRGVSFDWK